MIEGAESFTFKPQTDNGDKKIGILLLHGWSSSPYELRKLGRFLAEKGYYIHAPLLPGHGTKPEDLYGVVWKDWLDYSECCYEDFKKEVDDIFICGISMGGNLALCLASNGCSSTKGVITIGTPVFLKHHTLLKIFLPIIKRFRPITKKKYAPDVVKYISENKRQYWSFPTKSVKDAMDGMAHTRRNLKKVKNPVLVMQATKDRIVRQSNLRFLYSNLGTHEKQKEMFWVKDSEHEIVIYTSEIEAFNKISDFISNIISESNSAGR